MLRTLQQRFDLIAPQAFQGDQVPQRAVRTVLLDALLLDGLLLAMLRVSAVRPFSHPDLPS